MFYSTEILAHRSAEFYVIWQLSNRNQKIDKRSIMDQNVTELCHSIEQMIPNISDFRGNKKKMSLYLLAKLVFGTVVVHHEQAVFLERDVRGLIDSLKQGNLILKFAKKFEKEVRAKEKEARRSRSLKIIGLDDGEDLADLEKISRCLEINANPIDITLQDELPSSILLPFLDDLALTDVLNFQDATFRQATFVDGHSSDGSNREQKELINDERTGKKRKQKDTIESAPVVPKPPVVKQQPPTVVPDVDPMNWMGNQPILETNNEVLNQTTRNQPPIDPTFDIAPIPEVDPIVDVAPLPAVDAIDVSPIPPPVETPIPQIPAFVDEQNFEPTPKKARFENIRDQSTKPTPILHSTVQSAKIDGSSDEELRLDSQIIVDDQEKAKRPRIRRPKIYESNQIDEEEMIGMRDDYRALLRDKDDVMVKVGPKYPSVQQLFDPIPLFIRSKRLPSELHRLYGSGTYQNIGTFARDEDEESSIDDPIEKDRAEVFFSTFLLPPNEETMMDDPITTQERSHFQNLDLELLDLPPLPQPVADVPEEMVNEQVRLSSGFNEVIVPHHRKSTLYDDTPLVESLEAVPPPTIPTEKLGSLFFSSGSLIDARCELEDKLFDNVKEAYPNWFNFNNFTNGMTRKMAACAFNIILESAKDEKIEIKQAGGFEPIFLKEIREEMSTMSIRSGSSLSIE